MRAVDYVLKLQNEPSTNAKQDIILEAYEAGCDEFFKAFQLAYDSKRVFGVKKVPEHTVRGPRVNFEWSDFEELVRKLETREATGHDARDAMAEAAYGANDIEWNHLYRPILMKDMRCGTSDTLVNKVLNRLIDEETKGILNKERPCDNNNLLKMRALRVPVWKVQLASDSRKHPKKMVGKKAIDPKLDGMRLTAVLDKERGTAKLFTRSGKENTNFRKVTEDLEKLIKFFPYSMVLDGEIVSDNFQALMTQANRKSDVDTSDAHYALFDILSLFDFENNKGCRKELMDRDLLLKKLAYDIDHNFHGLNVYVIPKKVVDLDTEAGREEMQEFYEEMVAAGYEGIMVKDVASPYECKRTATWLKWKPIFSADLRIIAAYEGEPGKRREGKLGGFTCEGHEDGKHIIVNVGGGYNDDQIEDFWENQDSLIGDFVEVEYDAITKSEDGKHWSLRFPRFKRFRSIDQGEKI